MSHEKNFTEAHGQRQADDKKPASKKVYRAPVLSIYGRIERTTGGGSGMAKESFAMETFRFP